MVNIVTHQSQRIISSFSYLTDNPSTTCSLSDSHDEQINNADFSIAIDEKLTLLHSILATALPAENTTYEKQRPKEQEELVTTDVIIPINPPFSTTEITTDLLQSHSQHYSTIVDTDKNNYPINRPLMKKNDIVLDIEENHQIGKKIKSIIGVKQQYDDKTADTEIATFTANSAHLKNTSHKTVTEHNLSPTIANELNNIEPAAQENYRSPIDSNNLANNDSALPLAGWPTFQASASYQSDIAAEPAAKTATIAVPFSHPSPEAELRYTFTQWQGTHHVDIYRIADHYLQLMASNSYVMSILQRHLNKKISARSVSLSDTLNITLNEVLDNSDESGEPSS
uniref:Surface presentation of antigen domain-containing protein n=1 Tax=Arsenophonus endosymbiont of Trialeurodes vaporariorum TaxID=235567 RepID=A0A3B0M068_9GAMM